MYSHDKYICVTNRHLIRTGEDSGCAKERYLEQIKKCVRLRPEALILREKDLDESSYCELAKQVNKICEDGRVKMFIHGDFVGHNMDIMQYTGCHNIHMSLKQFMNESGRKDNYIAKADCISVSCHSVSEAQYAAENGASQVIVGTIFETECKPGKKGDGLKYLNEAADRVHSVDRDIKVYAVGGIKPDNIQQVIETGADGGCMMSWFMTH